MSSLRRLLTPAFVAVGIAAVTALTVAPAPARAAPTLGVNAAGVPVGPQLDEALATGAREVP